MNKKQKIEYLLKFVGTSQRDFFLKMYKSVDDMPPAKYDRAIEQIERTLLLNATASDKNKDLLDQHSHEVEQLKAAQSEEVNKLKSQHLSEVEQLKEDKSQTVDKNDREILYRLAKLSALEAGGVDNWEWYDESLANLDEEAPSPTPPIRPLPVACVTKDQLVNASNVTIFETWSNWENKPVRLLVLGVFLSDEETNAFCVKHNLQLVDLKAFVG